MQYGCRKPGINRSVIFANWMRLSRGWQMACVRRLRWQRGDVPINECGTRLSGPNVRIHTLFGLRGAWWAAQRGVSLNRVTRAWNDVLYIEVQVLGHPRIAITTPARS